MLHSKEVIDGTVMVSSESLLCLLATLKEEDEDSYQNVYVSLSSCILFDALQLTPYGSKPQKICKVWVAIPLPSMLFGKNLFLLCYATFPPPMFKYWVLLTTMAFIGKHYVMVLSFPLNKLLLNIHSSYTRVTPEN
jgi:hypothetical protein